MLQVRATSDKGRGLFALRSFKEGEAILIEKPVAALQHPENATSIRVCAHCLAPLGNIRSQLMQRLDSVIRDPNIIKAVDAVIGTENDSYFKNFTCPRQCGLNFCSQECVDAAESGHSPLCVRGKGDAEALVNFKEHALMHNDQFLMAGRMLASGMIGSLKSTFHHSNWMNAKLRDPSEDPEEFDGYMRETMQESFAYLVEGLRQDNNPDLTLEHFSELLSMFEFNNISIEYPCPVKTFIDERMEMNPKIARNVDIIEKALAQVAEEERKLFRDVECARDDEIEDDEDVPESDSSDLWPGLHGVGMFALASMINHSCEPNVDFEFLSNNSTLSVIARRDIQEGEEILHSYVSEDLNAEDRILSLFGYGFLCKCARCERECPEAVELVSSVFPERCYF
jgi:SET and MYND domain-containing protein 5